MIRLGSDATKLNRAETSRCRMHVLVAAGVGRYMPLEAYVRTYPH